MTHYALSSTHAEATDGLPERPGGEAALVNHEGISTPAAETACQRWPERFRLYSNDGLVRRGRCKATNRCTFCAKLNAVENCRVLTLDAMHGITPTILITLTTRTATLDNRRFYRSREKVLTALRRRWPECEVAWLLEFTTGYGVRSGGKRRPHWNGLLKGVPLAHVDRAREVIRDVWCAREDALPAYQYVEKLEDAGKAITYIAKHFQKESQKPPKGWTGHRFLKSRGYLWLPTPEARAVARDQLLQERELHKVFIEYPELDDAELLQILADDRVAAARERVWGFTDIITDDTAPSGPVRVLRHTGEVIA